MKNIVLVGFMGTGKTSTGKCVAERLGREFIDTDDLIERETGRVISEIFAADGEPFFRRLERDAARRLSQREDLVIGGGGGIVLDSANVEDFSRTGLLICLQADAPTILRRVALNDHRPLLEGGEKEQKILALLEQRRPIYDALPIQIDTNGLSPEQVAELVVECYSKHS